MKINIQQIIEGVELRSFGQEWEYEGYLDKETGELYFDPSCAVDLEPLPEDIEDEKYVALPHKKELGLGKELVLKFAASHIPQDYKKIESMFSQRGAYARFKDYLANQDMLDQWYEYEKQALHDAVKAWCQSEEIDFIE